MGVGRETPGCDIVAQWVTCIEAHHNTDIAENGQEMNLYHYHMAIKLEKRVWWF